MVKYSKMFYYCHQVLNTRCSEVKHKKSKMLPLETNNTQAKTRDCVYLVPALKYSGFDEKSKVEKRMKNWVRVEVYDI